MVQTRNQQRDNNPHLPRNPLVEQPVIHMIMGGPTEGYSNRAHRARVNSVGNQKGEMEIQAVFKDFALGFSPNDLTNIQKPPTEALVIQAEIGGYNVERVFVDTRSSVDIVFLSCFEKMNSGVKWDRLVHPCSDLLENRSTSMEK